VIRVLIADDHAIVREGLKQILLRALDFEIGGEAGSGHEVLERIRAEIWDLLLLDMSMPGRSGIELIRLIKAERPHLPILVLTMHAEEQYAVRAFRAGASGYLTKESAPLELVSAARKVAGGGVYVSAATAERMARSISQPEQTLPHQQLSDREFEVFRMIVAGVTVTEMAERLVLSVKTVSTHKARILQKMGMHTPAELIHYAVKHRLIEDTGPTGP
jgi:DNA-binding NarL/FixJ family response regulator